MAFQGASSSSSSTSPWTYHVFLSFRGEDTRLNLTSHLYAALCQTGIKTFKDDDDLRCGEEISPALVEAIQESKISMINDIRMVGILGAGGIGKTTIAKEIYNPMYSQFDDCCFLESVREASKKRSGMVKLQSKFLSTILGDTVKVDSVAEGISVIKRRLCSKRVLLILDDVDNKEELDKLAGGADWFGDHKVDQSDVQQLQSSFGEAFVKLEQRFKDDQMKVRKWKTALTHAANLLGYHLDDRDEAKCIGKIVQEIANHIKAAKQVAKHPIAIKSPLHVPDSSSSPAQVPDSSSSPSPVGIQAPVQAPNWSSSPSGNGEQGSNPSISSEQESNSFKSILQVILVYIGSVIATLQFDDFETHPVNMWISEAALVMFCLSWANMLNNDGTRWAKYSRINKNLCVLSGTLVLVSLISIHLPHQLWWLFFVIWALLGFIFVAHTWIYAGANRRNDEEMGQMVALILPTNSLTTAENSSDAAHFLRENSSDAAHS